MTTRISALIERAKVVLKFATTNAVAGASFAAVLTRLQGLLATADTLVLQQTDAKTTQHAAVERRLKLRKTLMVELLRRLVAVADVAAVDHAELINLIPPLRANIANAAFVMLAKSMLAAAASQKDVLIATGLGETVFDDLQKAITQFEADTEAAATGKLARIAASEQLKAIVRGCNREVRIIGTYMRATYAESPELLAAWKSARKVQSPNRKPAEGEEPAPAPEPIPAQQQVSVSNASPAESPGRNVR